MNTRSAIASGPGFRTLAPLTRFLGAKLGANDHRHRATPGHVQPLSSQLNGTPGHAGPHQAVLRECLLSSRSRVRVAVGEQVRKRTPAPFPPLGSQPGSQPTELRACGGPGTSHLAIARYITARQIPDLASGRRAALVPNANRGPCRVGNLFAIEQGKGGRVSMLTASYGAWKYDSGW